MLRINAITLTDFAPFKGEQRIEFRPEPGVTLITGSNGRGKTWLLNAIRYALFGHVLGRTDVPRDLSRVANWETTRETWEASFKVILEFEVDATNYRLTRRFVADARGRREEVLLTRGNSVLTQDETRRELERVLPEQIARFFLFDGELLRQYEELAVDPSRGDELKSAIERILGIPILANARNDITEITGGVTRALARAAVRNVQTQQLGASLQAAQDLLDQLSASVATLTTALDQLERERAELEDQMARSSRLQTVLARRDALIVERDRHQHELVSAEAALRARSGEAWRVMVAPTIDALVQAGNSDLGVLLERRRHAEEATVARAHRHRAAESGACPTCGQRLSDELRGLLASEAAGAEFDVNEIDVQIQVVRSRLEHLTGLRPDETGAPLEALESRVDDHRVQVADLSFEIEAAQDELRDAPEAELRDLALRFANVRNSQDNTRQRREQAEADARFQETAILALRERLSRAGGLDHATLERKADTLQALGDLYREAITHYRERLKADVEAEATRIFRALRMEPDYDHLAINPGYGLTIVHRDGEPITDRSAGYEHLVALSLLGALQRCAPITGPVIMDSQFGRLDPEHKARVVASLPEISDQVILLAYENEFDREQAAHALGGRLLAEKELVRITARHTEIRDRG